MTALNARRQAPEGKIVTFYSFKGGVGRTMALANVAFLAALNGKRVLVMDWDLEAPGLSYYFRGLVDAAEAKAIKASPGVLDLLWEWVAVFEAAEGNIHDLYRRYESGTAFEECVRSLLPKQLLEEPARLDYIGAGQLLQTSSGMSYEDALSTFSWTYFFEQTAGGALISNFRQWAKQNYDLVLIDSRTGLADVAGICTMQIPDSVIMCFVFNRQNIDGVARVSSAIRRARNGEIELRAIPMRTARQDTAEESDARARAVRELTKIGGYPAEIGDDFKSLYIPATENVPFYETLAPLTAQDPGLDVLTLSYMRLANTIVGEPLKLSYFDPEWVRTVRTRLQPRHATTEYVQKLLAGDSARAVEELHRLIEGAYELELDGDELDDEYARILISSAFEVGELSDDDEEALSIRERALDFARSLFGKDPEQWRSVLASSLEQYWDTSSYLLHAVEDQLLVLSELDNVLSLDNAPEALIRRIQLKTQAARIVFPDYEAARQYLGETSLLLKEAENHRSAFSQEQAHDVAIADIDLTKVRGDIHFGSEDFAGALSCYQAAVHKLTSVSPQSALTARLTQNVLGKISECYLKLGKVEEAAQVAVEAARVAGPLRIAGITSFAGLAQPIIRNGDPQLALRFVESALDTRGKSMNQLPPYLGRQTSFGLQYIDAAMALAELISHASGRTEEAIRSLAEVARLVLSGQLRRRQVIGKRDRIRLAQGALGLASVIKENWGELGVSHELESLASMLTSAGQQPE